MTQNTTLVFKLYADPLSAPVRDAKVILSDAVGSIEHILYSDASGRTPPILLAAPPAPPDMPPEAATVPYSVYNARIEADGYSPFVIKGIRLFEGVEGLAQIRLTPCSKKGNPCEEDNAIVPPPFLDSFPVCNDFGAINSLYIPEHITVHLGIPDTPSAPNVEVNFIDYIKNTAAFGLYPTWPEDALRAIIAIQISFTLGCVCSQRYRSQGYDFDITNSPAHDLLFVPNGNIFVNISRIADDSFNEYVSYANSSLPASASPQMSPRKAAVFAKNGCNTLNILRRCCADEVKLAEISDIHGIFRRCPALPLHTGDSSSAVRAIKRQLNRIRRDYPAIPLITSVDNDFTVETENAVKAFQRIWSLPPDGVIGKSTWYAIMLFKTYR